MLNQSIQQHISAMHINQNHECLIKTGGKDNLIPSKKTLEVFKKIFDLFGDCFVDFPLLHLSLTEVKQHYGLLIQVQKLSIS